LGDGDGIHRFVSAFCFGQRLTNYRHDRAEMFSRSQFRDDSAIGLMRGDLGSNNIRYELFARTYDGGGGFIAGAFDAENVGVRHVLLVSSFDSRVASEGQ